MIAARMAASRKPAISGWKMICDSRMKMASESVS